MKFASFLIAICVLTVVGANRLPELASPIYTCAGGKVQYGQFWKVDKRVNGSLCLSGPVALPTPTPTPPADSSPIGGAGHEPAGMTAITTHTFSCITSGCVAGWNEGSNNTGLSLGSDASAPKSPPGIATVTYPVGWPFGGPSGTPGSEEFTGAALGTVTTLYISAWIRLSSNWLGNPTGNNKLIYVGRDGQISLIAEAYGKGTDTLAQHLYLQNLGAPLAPFPTWLQAPATNTEFWPNVVSVQTKRGAWQHYEYLIGPSTVDAWVDGVQTHHVTGVTWNSPGRFSYVMWLPIWGGSSDPIPVAQSQDVDHLYVSGK